MLLSIDFDLFQPICDKSQIPVSMTNTILNGDLHMLQVWTVYVYGQRQHLNCPWNSASKLRIYILQWHKCVIPSYQFTFNVKVKQQRYLRSPRKLIKNILLVEKNKQNNPRHKTFPFAYGAAQKTETQDNKCLLCLLFTVWPTAACQQPQWGCVLTSSGRTL